MSQKMKLKVCAPGKLLPETLTSYIGEPGLRLGHALVLAIQLPANASWEGADIGLSTWDFATHVGDVGGVSGC